MKEAHKERLRRKTAEKVLYIHVCMYIRMYVHTRKASAGRLQKRYARVNVYKVVYAYIHVRMYIGMYVHTRKFSAGRL